jgi:RNA exonuclease 1
MDDTTSRFTMGIGRCSARDAAGGRTGGVGAGGRNKTAIVDHGNPGVMHGVKATMVIGCKTDDEVLKGLLGAIPTHQFTYGRFLGSVITLGCKRPQLGCPHFKL